LIGRAFRVSCATTPGEEHQNPPASHRYPLSLADRLPGYCVPLVLIFVKLLAYRPALRGGLLEDDQAHLTRSDLSSLPELLRIWFDLARIIHKR
jgi:hypothetical protein